MHPTLTERLAGIADDLLAAAKQFRSVEEGYTAAREQRRLYFHWRSRILHLYLMLGDAAKPWCETLGDVPPSFDEFEIRMSIPRVMGGLTSLAECLRAGLLNSVQQLIRAELHDDLLGQAEYLYKEGYVVAAGTIARAVLEEHLRSWCAIVQGSPAKPRPTIDDYKAELYRMKKIDKIAMKHVESMAAVGNDAAHNKPGLQAGDVERLLRDVREFLVKNPIS